ncbi:MAG: EAL domain-containing protein [Chromatiaceae bacterium]|nr:EAL domain-containing protein [Chromatiaceae bacterium]
MKMRSLDVEALALSSSESLPEALGDPGYWDLVLCEAGIFFDWGFDEQLREIASELDASLVLMKPRGSQLSPAEGFRWGAADVVQRGDTDHLLMVCERELQNCFLRKRLRRLNGSPRSMPGAVGRSMSSRSVEQTLPVQDLVDADSVMLAPDQPSELIIHQDEEVPERSALPAHLRIKSLIDAGGLTLEFQPIVSLKASGDSRSLFETLVRLRDESGNLMMPGEFLPIVAEAGWMGKIDLWIYRRALSILSQIRRKSRSRQNTVLFVNLATETLRSPQLVKALCGFTAAAKINPGSIVIELHKSALLEAPESVETLSRMLHQGEHGILLEDPGVKDCSFLEGIKNLVSYVKLQRTITQGLADGSIPQEDVVRLVSCAHQHRIQVIALSVDTAGLLPMMFTAGVDAIQGHFVSMPYQDLHHPNMHRVESGESSAFGLS